MRLTSNTILITGGASGIGLAMAVRFVDRGNDVIICGRRENALREARTRFPKLRTCECDLTNPTERIDLFEWAVAEHPGLNVLVNNAGVQRRVTLAEPEAWSIAAEEIEINLSAPIHLSRLFLPHLKEKDPAAIINISSGLGFAPLATVPIYSATKAAMHSYTLSLRHQLRESSVEVIEIAPPAVDTDLGGVGLHTFGTPVDEFVDAVFARLGTETEIGYGYSEGIRKASRDELDAAFVRMNANR